MEEMKIFQKAVKDPHTYAVEWKKKHNKPVVGYFCSYTPEEIIYAAGALPFRIYGSSENITMADSHLQSYCCSLVRGGLDEALKGKLSFLEGTVFPHTCDSIQRLSDIWRLNGGFSFHHDIVLPVKHNTKSAREYVVDLFRKFRRELGASLNREISDSDLKDAAGLYNEIRSSMMAIYSMKSTSPSIIRDSELFTLVKAATVMDRKEFLEALKQLIAVLEKKGPEADSRKRILLAGGVCNHPDIYDILTESGAAVIYDELCTGTRLFKGTIKDTGDAVQDIAERYTERIVCPAKHSSMTSRGENLARLAKEHNADGVIFMFLKFCDPQGFDYPYLKKTLDDINIPNMVFELEEQLPSEGQLRTRFEAFIEML